MTSQPHSTTLGTAAFIDGMRTRTDVEENGHTLRRAVYVVDENGYDFGVYEWPWTNTDIPPRSHSP